MDPLSQSMASDNSRMSRASTVTKDDILSQLDDEMAADERLLQSSHRQRPSQSGEGSFDLRRNREAGDEAAALL